MNLAFLWARVVFCAQNGRIEDFLLQSAQFGIRLRNISPVWGGVHAECPAWSYRKLFYLARKKHVSLHLIRRSGLFFRLRPLLRRRGIGVGLLVFLPLFFLSQQYIWSIQIHNAATEEEALFLSSLATTGQLYTGDFATEQRLSEVEQLLIKTGSYAWVNLNFFHGRLTAEFSPLHPKPAIWTGKSTSLYAKADGCILSIQVTSGTPLIAVGQSVTKGQELISTARTERDFAPAYEPADGTVLAQFTWKETCTIPLSERVTIKNGTSRTCYTAHFLGYTLSLPALQMGGTIPTLLPSSLPPPNIPPQTKNVSLSFAGLVLPFSIQRATYYLEENTLLVRSETEALSLARLSCLENLFEAFPNAALLSQEELYQYNDDSIHYTAQYSLVADICK